MGDRASIVGLESPHHFEGRREDADDAIVAAEEKAVRARAHTAYLVAFEEGPAFIVWGVDLADLEEIEGFPLFHVRALLAGCSGGVG